MKTVTPDVFKAICEMGEAVKKSFPKNYTIIARAHHDETIEKMVLEKGTETELATLKSGDTIIYYNKEYYKKYFRDNYKSTRLYLTTIKIGLEDKFRICPKNIIFTDKDNEEVCRIPLSRIIGIVR